LSSLSKSTGFYTSINDSVVSTEEMMAILSFKHLPLFFFLQLLVMEINTTTVTTT
jgi:hypothetical protein